MVLILKLCLLSSFYISVVDMSVKVVNVYFSSVNFHTILHWDAVCDVHPCTYNVTYKIYGEGNWTKKTDCSGTQNFCDMTTEMQKKEHLEDKMLAKVRAINGNVTSKWKMSKPFTPIRDTNISAPGVSLSSSATSIVVYITAPPLLNFSMYPEKEKEISFNIAVSYMSKLLGTYATNQAVWTKTQLSPGRYCITVKMKFEEHTSNPSLEECVNLNDLATTKVILGSAISICIFMIIAVILAVYFVMYRHVLHPKTHLPSNLIFNDVKTKSSASDYKPDEMLLAPSIFEGMEFCKHTLESDNNDKHSQNKRYVMTETWRKGYVNFRQKYTDPDNSLGKTVELRNSTYGTNAAEDCLLDNLSISISPEARYTKAKECLHYGLVCIEYDYYNNRTACVEGFKKPSQPYFNQEEKPHCFYINDQFQAYSNISGNA